MADSIAIDGPSAIPRPYDPFDYAVQEDPHPVYAWLREHAPVYRNERRDVWALSRHADVLAALRDPALFSNRNGISLEPDLWGPGASRTSLFLAMDPPVHGRYRRIVSSAFTPRRVASLEPRIRELARRRLAPLHDDPTFDFAADYAAALPNDVLCELLGIPAVDWDLIRHDTDELNHRDDGSDDRSRVSMLAALRLAAYFGELVVELRRRPGDDLTSRMLRAEVDGATLTDAQVVAFLFVMIGAGNESTGKTLANGWYHGWRLPEVAVTGLGGRAADWTNETLRYDSSSQMMARVLTSPTVLHGVRVPAGARIALLPASANRDPRVFDCPERFDLDRDTRGMLSFGHGPHHCLGAALARLEMRIAFEEVGALASSYEIDVDNARRCHSPHQRGFTSLPCTIRRRPAAWAAR